MSKSISIKTPGQAKRGRPALTPEARENQCIALAYNLAEEQLMNGTASAQVITHFLKAGTAKAQLETEKLRRENIVLEAKAAALEASKQSQALYEEAIAAFRRYSGNGGGDEVYDDGEY